MLEKYEEVKAFALDHLNECIACARDMQDIEVARQLEQCAQEIRSLRFNIAVVGDIKRGKSTLINTLLGQDNDNLSPIGTAVCTGVVTHYMDVSCLPEADEPHALVYTYDVAEPKRVDINAVANYIRESDNKNNWRNISRIEIYGRFPLLHSCCLVDTPGANAVIERHGELVSAFLPHADAIVMTVMAAQPVTASEAQMLKELSADTQRHIFYALTQIDTQNPKYLPETCGYVLDKIEQSGLVRPASLYQVACKPVYEARRAHLPEAEIAALRSKWGVEQLEHDLERFILQTSVNGSNLAKRIHEAVDKAKRAFQDKKRANEEIIKLHDVDALQIQDEKKRVMKEFSDLEGKVDAMIDQFESDWDRITEKAARLLPNLQTSLEERLKSVLDDADTVTAIKNNFELGKIVSRYAKGPLDDFMSQISEKYSRLVSNLDADLHKQVDVFTRVTVKNSAFAQSGGAVVSAVAVTAVGAVASAGYTVASAAVLSTNSLWAILIGGGSVFSAAVSAVPLLVIGILMYKCTGPLAKAVAKLSLPGSVEKLLDLAEKGLRDKAKDDRASIVASLRKTMQNVRTELETKLNDLDNRLANMDPSLKEQALLENKQLDKLLTEGRTASENALRLQ